VTTEADEPPGTGAERRAFLVRLAHALRPLADPVEVQATAARYLGEYLNANQVHYGETTGSDTVVIHRGYGNGLPPMLGTFDHSREGWSARLLDTYRAGRTAVCDDVNTDPTITPDEAAVVVGAGFHAYVGVPLVKEGRRVAILAVHSIAPRRWTADEVALVGEVAERIWATVERARAGAALQATETSYRARAAELRAVLESISDGVYIGNLNGITVANQAALDQLGFRTPEELKRPIVLLADELETRDWATGEQLAADGRPFARALRGERVVQHVRMRHRLSGQELVVRSSAAPVVLDGRVIAAVAVNTDVTEQKRAEQTLRTNEQRMRGQKEAFQAAIDGAALEDALGILARMVSKETAGEARTAFYIADPDGACLHPIRGAGDMPDSYTDQVDGFRVGEGSLACGLALATGRPVLTRDVFDEPRWTPWLQLAEAYDFRGCWSFPIETRDGNPLGTFAMYFRGARQAAPHDLALASAVTQAAGIIIARQTEAQERIRAEAALRQSEEKYRSLFETMGQGYCDLELVRDAGGRAVDQRYLELNPAFERLFGIRATRATGRRASEVLPELEPWWHDTFDRIVQRGEPERIEHEVASLGRWFEIFVYPRGGDRLTVLYEDVTEHRRAEEALRESEARRAVEAERAALIRSVLDALPDAVIVADERVAGILVNPAYRALYRLDLDPDFFQRSGEERARIYRYRDLDDRPIAPEAWPTTRALRGEALGGNEAIEARMDALDGTTLELTFTAGPIRDPAGHITGAVTTARDIRARRAIQAERERLLSERQVLLRRIVRVQEEERARLAHEVHDSVTQLVHAAAIHLDNAVELLDGAPTSARAELGRGRDLARRAANEARRLIAGLRPETLDMLGLSGALQQEVEALRAAGWRVDFEDADLSRVRLEPEAEITLFRLAQEALLNVRKHAGYTRVRVRLKRQHGSVRLEVRDWGRGFEPMVVHATPAGEHVGLAGMRWRMDLLGGRLTVTSGLDHGTTVRATLPLPSVAQTPAAVPRARRAGARGGGVAAHYPRS
jgi:PAS domain S-box-containing protein